MNVNYINSFIRKFVVWFCLISPKHLGLLLGISNCCPSNSSLKITKNDRTPKYQCIENSNSYYETNQFVIHGLNFVNQNQNTINILNCRNPDFIKITKDISIKQDTSCFTKYNNEIYAISCPSFKSNKNSKIIPVNFIRKCCPYGRIFDRVNKICSVQIGNANFEGFQRFFGTNPILFNDKTLDCPDSEDIVVEYFWQNNQFKFDGSNLLIQISSNQVNTFDSDSYCIEETVDHNNNMNNVKKTDFLVRTCNRKRICDTIPCIRKCCPANTGYISEKPGACIPSDDNWLSVDFHKFKMINGEFVADIVQPKAFGIQYGQSCLKYKLEPEFDMSELYYISHQDGAMHLPNQKSVNHYSKYCIENYEATNRSAEMRAYLCFIDNNDSIKFTFYGVAILISCGFFALTLLVYLCVPKLRNLPGKILICLVLNLLVVYLGVAIGQLAPPGEKLCYAFAFFIYYSSMAAFAWMNVMCFDIWLTFGTTERTLGIPFDRHDIRRFLLYTLYALGLPAVLTSTTMLVTYFEIIADSLQPKFGEGRCWFQSTNGISHIVFFIVPVGMLFLINLILFVLTLRYCNQVKREIHRMQSTNDDNKHSKKSRFTIDRARFMMNTKLFVVMGITWILEIVSTTLYERSNMFFWVISDMFNVLQGVLVFFIFVFKWRVWDAILDRFGVKTTKRRRRPGATTGATTSTFTGSTGNLNVIRMKSLESNSSLMSPSNIVATVNNSKNREF